jgi:tetratricopeptide (TPR) repeat protein
VRSVIDRCVQERDQEEKKKPFDDALLMYNAKQEYCKFLKQVGVIYDQYGDYEAAHEIYQKCLSIRRAVQEMNQLDVAEAYWALFSCGSLLPSRDMYLEALTAPLPFRHIHSPRRYFATSRQAGSGLRTI